MLRTNSKQARANVRKWISENINQYFPLDYNEKQPVTFEEMANAILTHFRREKAYSTKYATRNHISEFEQFQDWTQGLPGTLNCDYYFYPEGINTVASILKEGPEEVKKYSEEQAENLLTFLIYNELKKGAKEW